jgi:hypothetical protein
MVVAEISFQQLANLGFCSTAFRPRSERSVAVVKGDDRVHLQVHYGDDETTLVEM